MRSQFFLTLAVLRLRFHPESVSHLFDDKSCGSLLLGPCFKAFKLHGAANDGRPYAIQERNDEEHGYKTGDGRDCKIEERPVGFLGLGRASSPPRDS